MEKRARRCKLDLTKVLQDVRQEENSKNSKQALHQTLKMQATESSPAESWAESARRQNRNCSEKQNVSWIKNYTTLQ